MSSYEIIGIIVIVLNAVGLFSMLIMSVYAIKNKNANFLDKRKGHVDMNKKFMKTDFNAADLHLDDKEDIFEDMDLMDFDELNLDEFD